MVRQAQGFTLVELIIVIVILGVMAVAIVPQLGDDKLRGLVDRETARLQAVMNMARDEAIFRGEELGMQFQLESYRFLLFSEEGWQAIENDRVLAEHTLPQGLNLDLQVEGEGISLGESAEEERLLPDVVLLSSGEVTPFNLRLYVPSTANYERTLEVDLSGQVALVTEEAEDAF